MDCHAQKESMSRCEWKMNCTATAGMQMQLENEQRKKFNFVNRPVQKQISKHLFGGIFFACFRVAFIFCLVVVCIIIMFLVEDLSCFVVAAVGHDVICISSCFFLW